MTRKKVLIVIVEGVSEQVALENCLTEFLTSMRIRFKVVHGDITSHRGSNPNNILIRVGDLVSDVMRNYRLRKSDMAEIVHIVDTDGAFIPDSFIFSDESLEKVMYKDDGIYARDRESLIRRNNIKRANLYRLISCKKIRDIPYHVYYMSSNLEHVLAGKQNCTDAEKMMISHDFSLRYENRNSEFLHFIESEEISVSKNYLESWNFIEKELNSLKRHSNLNTFFQRMKEV